MNIELYVCMKLNEYMSVLLRMYALCTYLSYGYTKSWYPALSAAFPLIIVRHTLAISREILFSARA